MDTLGIVEKGKCRDKTIEALIIGPATQKGFSLSVSEPLTRQLQFNSVLHCFLIQATWLAELGLLQMRN